ncbi:MAG: 2-oxoglutarate dehydrogenase complex dihydrolipoyllysine-residue succinyltransferase [Gammaproteobacteria bacterium]
MSVEIKVPVLPESVADAVVASWYKKAGDSVQQDETLVDLETDKVILEVPALRSGVLKEIRFEVGETVTANQVLAVIDDTASAGSNAPSSNDNAEAAVKATKPAVTPEEIVHVEQIKDTPSVSPSARKLMAEHGLDLASVHGSGKGGRVLKQDVADVVDKAQSDVTAAPRAAPRAAPAPVAQTVSPAQLKTETPADPGERIEKRVPMTRLRARIAERLLQAQSSAAILTTFNEVNMKPVMDLRARYKDRFEKTFGVRLGFMSFFIKASVEALKKFPAVNASIDDTDIVYHGFFDVGIAVSGPNGLVVPIIRDADQMSIAELEQAIVAFADKAKNNSLSIEDITGGTFTITNGGVFGSMLSTPILNPPQSAILGMHNIRERAMVVDGNIVALPMMYLALSYDHRIIDGREAVQFLVTIRDFLEDPSRMILGL